MKELPACHLHQAMIVIKLFERITGLSFAPSHDSDKMIFEITENALKKFRN